MRLDTLALLSFTGYLIGSLPVAWVVTKLVKGEDLRQLGSGNVGVMNVGLSVSRWAGILVFLAEAMKGVFAVYLARELSGDQFSISLTALATVAGTRWPIWLRFKGGRGNTAGFAAVLMLSWHTVLIGAGIWILARVITKASFYATRLTLLIWPVTLGLLTESIWFGIFGALLSLMYLTTHDTETDDHMIIKERWPSFWAFLTGPKRHYPG
jgi:glycerol-3-phosphate acyltransferase PlsY